MSTLDGKLAKHLCEFKAREAFNTNFCEECNHIIPEGGDVYFFSDGGYESRDGTYTCRKCAEKIVALLLPSRNGAARRGRSDG